MAGAAEPHIDTSALLRLAEGASRPAPAIRQMADAVKALILEAMGPADAGLALGMADAVTALWARHHKFDAADPHWPDRDRFVLCTSQGAILLQALIYLTGHDGLVAEDLQTLRHSPVHALHPDCTAHPAIEAATGPFGQGLACAVGMALAERHLAARFGRSLVDHCTWVLAAEQDMTEGASHEAASLAGQLALAKLTVLYHDAGGASEATQKRFSAYGWATKRVDAYDPGQLAAALSFAVRSKKPTLIACERLDNGTGDSLDRDAGTRPMPDDALDRWHHAGRRGASARRAWLKRLTRHPQRGEFERVMAGRLPETWHEAIQILKQEISDTRPRRSVADSGVAWLDALALAIPELLCGLPGRQSRDLPLVRGVGALGTGNSGSRTLPIGPRDLGMAAAANGLALHRGVLPVIGTEATFSDSLRPALRMAAVLRQRVVYLVMQDPADPDIDDPMQHGIDDLAGLRAMSNVHVFRPADAMEVAECWDLAMRRTDGPSVLVLSRQVVAACRTDAGENRCARGGYVLAEAEGPRQATLIATGPEVAIALRARERLAAEGIAAAVVSLPSWELFALQDELYRAQVIGGCLRVGIEAAGGFGWDRWLSAQGVFIGPGGASSGASSIDRLSGLTAEAVAVCVVRRLAPAAGVQGGTTGPTASVE
jgi:transketolase